MKFIKKIASLFTFLTLTVYGNVSAGEASYQAGNNWKPYGITHHGKWNHTGFKYRIPNPLNYHLMIRKNSDNTINCVITIGNTECSITYAGRSTTGGADYYNQVNYDYTLYRYTNTWQPFAIETHIEKILSRQPTLVSAIINGNYSEITLNITSDTNLNPVMYPTVGYGHRLLVLSTGCGNAKILETKDVTYMGGSNWRFRHDLSQIPNVGGTCDLGWSYDDEYDWYLNSTLPQYQQDTVDPVISFLYRGNTMVNSQAARIANIKIRATDNLGSPGLSAVRIEGVTDPAYLSIVMGQPAGGDDYTITPSSPLTEGHTYRIVASAVDGASNIGSGNIYFKYDNTAPTLTVKYKGNVFAFGSTITALSDLSVIVNDAVDSSPTFTPSNIITDAGDPDIMPGYSSTGNTYTHQNQTLPSAPGYEYSQLLKVTDAAGLDAYTTVRFILDDKPPVIGIKHRGATMSNGTNTAPPLMTLNISDETDPTPTISAINIRGITNPAYNTNSVANETGPGTKTYTFSPVMVMTEGNSYRLTVTATDNGGNASTLVRTFIYDSNKPTIAVTYDGNAFANGTSISDLTKLTAIIGDNVDASPVLTTTAINTGPSYPDATPTFARAGNVYTFDDVPVSYDPGQTLTMTLTVTDDAGRTQAYPMSFVLDNVPPTVNTIANSVPFENFSAVRNVGDVSFTITDDTDPNPTLVKAQIKLAGGGTVPLATTNVNGKYIIDATSMLDNNGHILELTVSDGTGNIGVKNITFTADTTPPEIVLKKDGELFVEGDAISSILDVIAELTDALSTNPSLVTADVTGGAYNIALPLTISNATPRTGFEYSILQPTVPGSDYLLTLVGRDNLGNTSTKTYAFAYSPRTVKLTSTLNNDLKMPALDRVFTRSTGHQGVYSEPLTFSDNTVVGGAHEVYAYSNPSSTLSVIINGVEVRPGDNVVIASAYGFTGMAGSYDFTIQPTKADVIGTANINIQVDLEDTPVLKLKASTWKPTVELVSNNWDVEHILGEIAVDMTIDSSTYCRLSSQRYLAEGADMYGDPICYVEFINKPELTQTVEDPQVGVRGISEVLGANKLEYELSIFDGQEQIVLGSGEATVNIIPVSLTYIPDQDISSVYQSIESFNVNLDQPSGSSCRLTMNADNAKNINFSGTRYCYLEWTRLPDGLYQKVSTSKPNVIGEIAAVGSHTLAWRVSLFQTDEQKIVVSEGNAQINVVVPPPPELYLLPAGGVELINDQYMVTYTGGKTAEMDVVAPGADINIVMLNDGKVVSTKEYKHRSGEFSRVQGSVIAPARDLWATTKHTVRVEYDRLPGLYTEQVITSVAVPSKNVSISMEAETYARSVVNTDGQRMIVTMDERGLPFTTAKAGEWDVYIGQQDKKSGIRALTPAVPMGDSGVLTFDVDVLDLEYGNLIAVATLRSPYQDYERELNSTRISFGILEGRALEGEIAGRRMSGQAPFRASLYIRFEEKYISEVGDVNWMLSNDEGATWNVVDNNQTKNTRYYNTFDKGTYKLKATIYNKLTGATHNTAVIDLVAYNRPDFDIKGSFYMFQHSTGSVSPVFKEEDIVIEAKTKTDEWMVSYITLCEPPYGTGTLFNCEEGSWVYNYLYNINNAQLASKKYYTELSYDNGETWKPVRGQEYFNRDYTAEIKEVSIKMRARAIEAPVDDIYAYSTERGKIRVVEQRAIKARISGPRKVEVGKEYTFEGIRNDPYKGMYYFPQNKWMLPDGKSATTTFANYMPTLTDEAAGTITVQYTAQAYVSSIENNTIGEAEHTANVWQYVWPDFDLEISTKYGYAPTSGAITVTQNPRGLPLEGLEVEWIIPNEVVITRNRGLLSRYISSDVPGTHTITAIVRDARGNETVLTKTLTLATMPPLELYLKEYGSITNRREPYTGTYRVSVAGGHRDDRVEDIAFFLDGVAQDPGEPVGVFIMGAGEHTVRGRVNTRMGITQQEEVTFTVAVNQVPSCILDEYDRTSYYLLVAKCDDPDGYIRGYEWYLDGVKRSDTSYKSSFDKALKGVSEVKVRTIDDSGEFSDFVFWN